MSERHACTFLGRPTLCRHTVWRMAVESARAAGANRWEGFRTAGAAASVLGCDIGAMALPYLIRAGTGDALILALASAAHRPDLRAVARLTGASVCDFLIDSDMAGLGGEPPKALRILVDWEFARRPVSFLLVGEHAALTTSWPELLRRLAADPADLAADRSAAPLFRRRDVAGLGQ